MRQKDGRGHRNRGISTPTRRGHFVDVKTLASALFARSFSLSQLGLFLNVPNPKIDFDDFDGPITNEMIGYAMGDVQTTWECYRELTRRFDRLGFTRTIPEKIYSEASIGKGHLREMGIRPWRDVQPGFPRHLLAKIMGSYFGGRSEVRIRREMRQVVLCDFLSMYPTDCTLMNLWRFVIADGLCWRESTTATRRFLKKADLASLQSKATWLNLATLVRVRAAGEVFPIRASYSDEAQTTIGANHLTSGTPLWFTLADCIAAKLLTGKAPKVVEAITFEPGAPQAGLQPINIAGNAAYQINPYQDDFFKRLIELRKETQKRMAAATGAEFERLDTEQNSIKITANSVSYGIYIEVNVDSRNFKTSTTVHSSTCSPFNFSTDKSELPGSYFHPLLGTLITGAARLMLAIAETLITQSQLDWSFCDTDSIAIAKPDALDPTEFDRRVKAIVSWFEALNPYSFPGSILKIEDVNSGLETGLPEPLYCWPISSKRYALFNLADSREPKPRKVSAHGLGQYFPPYGEDDAPTSIPAPHKSVLGKGIERWHCDFWHQIVRAALAGTPDQVDRNYHPALSQPAVSRYGATTPELLNWFCTVNVDRSYRDQVKPFNFLLAMTAKPQPASEEIICALPLKRRARSKLIKPIAPFDKCIATAIRRAFDRQTGRPICASELRTLGEARAQYHLHPESKFLNGDFCDHGTTGRRHVQVTGTRHIGKEANDWERQAVLGLNAESEPTYGFGTADPVVLAKELHPMIVRWGKASCARAFGISAVTLSKFIGHPTGVKEHTCQLISSRMDRAKRLFAMVQTAQESERNELAAAIARDGLRSTARRLRMDPSNLRRKARVILTPSCRTMN
jgi:hypothetical protein